MIKFNSIKSPVFLKKVVSAMLLIVYAYTIFFTYIHNRNSEGYILGDWLINYQDGGFKRRGLSGTFFFFLQDLAGFSLQNLVFTFQFFLISFFFYFYYKLIRKETITLLYLSLLLSPLGFVALLNNVDYVGKKEFLLFAIFVYFIYLIQQRKLTLTKEYVVVFFLTVFMFFHEIILFFIPYFLIAKFINDDYKIRILSYLKYILAVFIPALLIILFGKNINEGNSILYLQERGVYFTKGILFWNIDEKAVLRERFNDSATFILSFALFISHTTFYIKNAGNFQKIIAVALLIGFLYSLPLFYVGLDWGRWLYIHMLMFIIFAVLLLNKTPGINKAYLTTIIVGIIIFSFIYRIDLTGSFSWKGLFYRVFVAPTELLHKLI